MHEMFFFPLNPYYFRLKEKIKEIDLCAVVLTVIQLIWQTAYKRLTNFDLHVAEWQGGKMRPPRCRLGLLVSVAVVTLLTGVSCQVAEKHTSQNPCVSKQTCHECIQTPTCAWCWQPVSTFFSGISYLKLFFDFSSSVTNFLNCKPKSIGILRCFWSVRGFSHFPNSSI